ncbi:MAG: hypothetical protein BGO39_28245 [Chloroflexi bacterium 54-19]|nr:MAG: hypothetical protein BGO39_28245 [Chloroflexi bacterium 54-19]
MNIETTNRHLTGNYSRSGAFIKYNLINQEGEGGHQMWQNNNSYRRPNPDIAAALKNLVEAGFNEKEIAAFARLRARYAQIPDHIQDYPTVLSKQEITNLSFYRWLVQKGRL